MLHKTLNKTEPFIFVFLNFLLFVWTFCYLSFISHNTTFSHQFLKNIAVSLFFVFNFTIIQHTIRQSLNIKKGYSTLFIVFLLFIIYPKVLEFNRLTITQILLLFSLRYNYSINLKQNNTKYLFNTGLFVGLAFFLYHNSLFFWLLLIFTYLYKLRGIDRYFFMSFFGFLNALIITGAIMLVRNQEMGLKSLEFKINNIIAPSLTNFQEGIVTYVALLSFFGLIGLTSRYLNNVNQGSFFITLVHFIISIFLIWIDIDKLENLVLLIFLPIALFVNYFIDNRKKYWVKEALLWSIIISASIQYFI